MIPPVEAERGIKICLGIIFLDRTTINSLIMTHLSRVSLAAIVLAGGQSSRMGQDKALIAVKGLPLLRQVCELATQLASPVYVVTPWTERYEKIVPSGCQLIREVSMPGEGKTRTQGPLVGLAQGLRQVKTEWVLALACDLPRLEQAEVQRWIGKLPEVSPDAIALLPRHQQGWWEPLCGFYRRRTLPLMEAYIAGGGRSFQGWLAQHPVEELQLSDREMLFNCNTPADLEQLQP